MYAEWAPNEKVAFEAAYGAAIGGGRAFCAMKHVGLNVAADPLFVSGYTGINGGFVIGVADDPGMHSSQNEQDSRHYAIAAKVPMLEPADSAEAYAYAMSFSHSKTVIVETFLVRDGYQIDADCFMYGGELVYFNPMDQHQDKIAPYSPIGISAPSILGDERKKKAHEEVSRFLKLLNMRFGEYNVEYIFDAQGRIYILEIGPRTGGNLIPDVIREGTGFDIVAANVMAHLGEPCQIPAELPFVNNVTSFIIHSQEDGIFDGLDIHPEVEKGILFTKLFVQPGEQVRKFTSGIYAMGFCLMKFEDHAFMLEVMDHTADYIKVKVR